ncbi:MAG: alpha/beta fold hydrolase [Alphaproteobacteria bacterium]|nr:alpha/beta fold hydrolase [Alphaproteobacteria bacterium]
MLHKITNGSGGVPLLIAHGLFGSAKNWNVLCKRLSDQRQVDAVDMRNHGASPWFDTMNYQDMANDLAAEINGRADVLGHSMGGKAAMLLALTRPEKVARLIVADIAPVGYGHTQTPLIEAMQDVDLTGITSRRDVDAMLADKVEEAAVRAFLLQSLDLTSSPPRWRLNLDILAAQMTDIIGFPAMDAQFNGPVLFLTGGVSDYVRAEHHDRILRLFPQAEFRQIAAAGHWLHAEKPREFETEVRAFLGG